MARHVPITNTNGSGVDLCDKCREPWPCTTWRRRLPYQITRKYAGKPPRLPSAAQVAEAVRADLTRRGPSEHRDLVTRVFVELDGSETWQIYAEIDRGLRQGTLVLDGDRVGIRHV